MTLKAVYPHAGVGVTALTELFRCVDWYRLAVLVAATMTTYALDKAVLLRTYALVHGPIALVQKKLHVILTHDFRRLDASLCSADPAACRRKIRLRHPTISRGRRHTRRSEQDQSHAS